LAGSKKTHEELTDVDRSLAKKTCEGAHLDRSMQRNHATRLPQRITTWLPFWPDSAEPQASNARRPPDQKVRKFRNGQECEHRWTSE